MFIAVTEKGELVSSWYKKDMVACIGKPFKTKATVWAMPYSDNVGGGNWFMEQVDGEEPEGNELKTINFDINLFITEYPFNEIPKGNVRFLGKKKPRWYRLMEEHGVRKKYDTNDYLENDNILYINSRGKECKGKIFRKIEDVGFNGVDYFDVINFDTGKLNGIFQRDILYKLS